MAKEKTPLRGWRVVEIWCLEVGAWYLGTAYLRLRTANFLKASLNTSGDLFDLLLDLVDILFHIVPHGSIHAVFFCAAHHLRFDIICGVFDAAHPFSEAAGDLRDLIGTKDHHQDEHNKCYLGTANKKRKCLHSLQIYSHFQSLEKGGC